MGSAELLLIAGLLLIGIAVYLAVSTLLNESNKPQQLTWGEEGGPDKSKGGFIEFSRPLVHRLTLKWALKIKNPSYRRQVERKILTAGQERVLNVDEFIGLQILWGAFMPGLFIVVNFALELGYPPWLLVAMAILGFYFPHIHCNTERKKRYQSVIVDLPFFIDILALSTEAGLDFIGAINKVVEKAKASVLADELGKVLRDIKLGQSRADALRAMADRLDMTEVTSFVAMIIDSDATGGSIGQVLKDQSAQMRMTRFTRAEKAGARASQQILLPLVLFILPAVLIMVMGPIIIQFLGQGG
ncbi:MAG TPA: type II secretion system F family protein [Bdellovibrionales bacterium]|nr:type II secretion system F family protein [Bdellovibrionales bacterium]